MTGTPETPGQLGHYPDICQWASDGDTSHIMWTRVTLVWGLVLGARGDTGGHHHPGDHHHHHGHELHDQQAAEASDQPVLYYANPEDPSQVYSQQGERDAGDMR